MKKAILLYSILLIIVSCTNNNEDEILNNEPNSFTRITMAYSEDTSDVSVLIFGKEENGYKYQRTLSSGWVDNRISTNLELGKYKFLFTKVPAQETTFSAPDGKTLEEIRISAKDDNIRTDYVLGVDEIWMPETADLANTIYTISGNDLIPNKLVRSVSQVEVYIKRGTADDNAVGGYAPIAYETGDITDDIGDLELHIKNVGRYIDYRGSHGTASTYYKATAPKSISNEGFAFFQSPFVFPTESATETAGIDITLQGKGKYPIQMAKTINGKLERNKKLVITLWLAPVPDPIYGYIDITVDITEMEDNDEVDYGIWE